MYDHDVCLTSPQSQNPEIRIWSLSYWRHNEAFLFVTFFTFLSGCLSFSHTHRHPDITAGWRPPVHLYTPLNPDFPLWKLWHSLHAYSCGNKREVQNCLQECFNLTINTCIMCVFACISGNRVGDPLTQTHQPVRCIHHPACLLCEFKLFKPATHI